MKAIPILCAASLLLGAGTARCAQADTPVPQKTQAKGARPNILFILCDDLGYGDLSCFGQTHFRTPNLDRMAAEGTRLTRHYCSAPVCAPSRASLMLGVHAGDSPVRDQQFDRPIPNTLTLASVLHQAGYRTLAIGKWGLGGKPAQGFPAHPQKRGFDAWYGLYTHADGHVHYPDTKHPLFDGYKDVTDDVKDCYSTDLYTAKAKQWIADQVKSNPEQPFFLYLAYIAPHEAFNVPDGPYPAGGGLSGGVSMPLATHPESKNQWVYPEFRNAVYHENDDLNTPELPWTRQMRRYATMVHRIDDAVGDLLQTLRDLNIDKNTLIVFTSDNGPAYDDGLHPSQLKSWGPLDGFKRDLYEGGYREPTLVRWPGTVPAGVVSDRPSVHYDWLPTLCDVAGLTPPAESDGLSLLPSLTGRKSGDRVHDYMYFEYSGGSNRREDHEVLQRHGYTVAPPGTPGDPWGQQQAVQIGDFVGIRIRIKTPDDPIRLYNTLTDPHEDHDLAAEPRYAALVTRMKSLMTTAHIPQPGNPRPYEHTPLPAVTVSKTRPGLHWRAFHGVWPWVPETRVLKPDAEGDAAQTGAVPSPKGPGVLELTGYLNAPTTGSYALTLEGGQRAHLWVQEAHVLDTEADSQSPRRTGELMLSAGLHPFRILIMTDGKTPLSPRLHSTPQLTLCLWTSPPPVFWLGPHPLPLSH